MLYMFVCKNFKPSKSIKLRVDSQKPNISFQEMLNNIAELNDIGSKKTVVDDRGRVELMIEYNSKLYTDYRSGINKTLQ